LLVVHSQPSQQLLLTPQISPSLQPFFQPFLRHSLILHLFLRPFLYDEAFSEADAYGCSCDACGSCDASSPYDVDGSSDPDNSYANASYDATGGHGLSGVKTHVQDDASTYALPSAGEVAQQVDKTYLLESDYVSSDNDGAIAVGYANEIQGVYLSS